MSLKGIGKAALVVLPILLVLYAVYQIGYSAGSNKITSLWQSEKIATEKEVGKLRDEYAGKEAQHRQDSRAISDELARVHEKHVSDLALVESEYAERLRKSQDRTGIYKRLSEAGSLGQARLVDHASKLDASLEEGRRLVREFQFHTVQRDRELNLLGDQILADRKVIEENAKPSASVERRVDGIPAR